LYRSRFATLTNAPIIRFSRTKFSSVALRADPRRIDS
jgi:hypothetical protein